ncbi:MAG TPA: DUF1249 domain-containing protein [Gammaproteobacteria bacterium]|jgi:hypothetical protein|nr:DUF1249 domain-containing protein [Gammaproteobacteria bacterium]
MFVETIEQHVRLVRPRSFAGLMTLYETNHVRMKQLLGNLRRVPEHAVSSSATDLSLYLSVQERSRYTTVMQLTYWFDGTAGSVADPDLAVRVYHDARLAEAVSCAGNPRHAALQGLWRPARSELEHRWTLNILLHKWLEFCLDNRHRFPHTLHPIIAR